MPRWPRKKTALSSYLPVKLLLVYIIYFERDIPTYHPQVVESPTIENWSYGQGPVNSQGRTTSAKGPKGFRIGNTTIVSSKVSQIPILLSITIHQAHRQKRAYSTRAAAKEALQILYPPSSSSQKECYGGGPWSASTSHCPPHDTLRSISLPRAKQGPATPSKTWIRLHQPAQTPHYAWGKINGEKAGAIHVALGQDPAGLRNAIDPKKTQIYTALTQWHDYESKLEFSRYRGIFFLSRNVKSLEKAVKEQLVGQSDECLIISLLRSEPSMEA